MPFFAAPWFLAAGLAAVGVTVGLHLLRRSERRPALLPTARFIPPRAASPFVQLHRPSDAMLLALRVTILLLASAALARPHPESSRRGVARVVLMDRSRTVASVAELRDSVRALAGVTTLLAFDSTAWPLEGRTADSITLSAARGSLSTALVAGIRAAQALRASHAEVHLDLVSPLSAEELDEATLDIRHVWDGAVDVHRVRARSDSGLPPRVDVVIAADEALGAGLRLSVRVPSQNAEASVRMRRGAADERDRAWLDAGHRVLVLWPSRAGGGDTLQAVVSDAGAVIGRMSRVALSANGRPIAWWSDGGPAVLERAVGSSCVREVGLEPSAGGDFVISMQFQRLVRRLAAPCGGPSEPGPVAALFIAALATASPPTATAAVVPEEDAPLSRWLLLAALAGAVGELALRRRPEAAPERRSRAREAA